MSARDLLAKAESDLAEAGVPSPRADAELLLAHVLGVSRGVLPFAEPDDAARATFAELVARRAVRVPLQHLTGVAGFRHMELVVGPGVFVPRPETESVVGAALDSLDPSRPAVCVDLCTGSGAIALALATELRGAEVHAVELSADALRWARSNIERQRSSLATSGSSVILHEGDATVAAEESLRGLRGRVDLVVSNPPYIPDLAVPRDPEVRDHDPHMALFGGDDGLDIVRGVVVTAERLLKNGGVLVVEHAEVQGWDPQADPVPRAGSVASVMNPRIWRDVATGVDLAGRPRWTQARMAGWASP